MRAQTLPEPFVVQTRQLSSGGEASPIIFEGKKLENESWASWIIYFWYIWKTDTYHVFRRGEKTFELVIESPLKSTWRANKMENHDQLASVGLFWSFVEEKGKFWDKKKLKCHENLVTVLLHNFSHKN